MKKVIAFIVALLILASLNISSFATTDTYELDDLGLEVTIPSNYVVFTIHDFPSDQVLNELGVTRADVLYKFYKNDIYLNALSNIYNEEIVVTMQENTIDNFSSFSDDELKILASELEKEYVNYGISVTDYQIYHHPQTKFIKIDFKDTKNAVVGKQFYTIYNNKAMNFTLRSYEDMITSADQLRQQDTIKSIVDSIIYYNVPVGSENQTNENISSFVYTDSDSGVKFTVPANWKQKEFNSDRKYLDAKFVSTKEDGCVIIFGSTDMWVELPASEKNGYNRKDLNNSFLTKSDIAEMYGVSEDKISVVTYNGVQYYKGETTKLLEKSGLNISVTTTQLICINDGWMYMFQFTGTNSHALYSDFERLLNSVSYPSGSITSNNDSPDQAKNLTVLFVLVIFALVIVGVIIAIMIFRRRKVLSQNKVATEIVDMYSTDVLCEKCGQTLPSDSEFCHICGTKVN